MTEILKKVVVMMIAISMLVSGSGIGVFADSINEGAANGAAAETAAEEKAENNDAAEDETADKEEGSEASKEEAKESADADKAEEEKKASDAADDEKSTEKEDAASDKDEDSKSDEKAEDEEKKLTDDDWEAKLPKSLPSDIRNAAAAVAKSQIGAEGELYRAFANASSKDKWDGAFALFVLNYAKVLDADKALGSSTKGTVNKNGKKIPLNADAAKWAGELKGADLISKADDDNRPEKGDIVFTNGGKTASVVTGVNGDTLTLAGAGADGSKDKVCTFSVKAGSVSSFVSLKSIASEKFGKDDSEDSDDEDEEDSDEDAADKAEEMITTVHVEEEEPIIPEKDEEGRELEEKSAAAEVTKEPGVAGTLKSMIVKKDDAEITVNGYMPEGARVEAYPVSVQIRGEKVLAAYDITIYVPEKDANGELTGEESEWQPVVPLTVSVKDDSLSSIKNSVNVYHMEDKNASAEFVAETEIKGDKVSFSAEGFSIYVVTVEPTVTYVFYNGTDEYSRQVLTNGKTLAEPTSPVSEGRVFKYWSASQDGDAFEGFGQKVTVDENGGGIIPIYAVYETKKFRITYYDQNGGIVETQLAASTETVDPSEIEYTPIQNEEGVHLKFLFWTDDPYDSKAEKKSFSPTDNIKLYPVVEAGHWIYFDVNKSAVKNTSTDYAANVFVKPGENNKPGTTDDPVSITRCSGYEFLGWYTKKNGGSQVFDAKGIRNDEGYAKITKNGELYSEPTLYAQWGPGVAPYTVSYYVQKASDEVGGEKHYEFYKTGEVRYALAGSSVSLDQTKDTVENVFAAEEGATDEEKKIAKQDMHGFVRCDNSESAVVKPDGTTELQVKFDRKPFTLKLYNFAQRNNLIGTSDGKIEDNVVTNKDSSAYTMKPKKTIASTSYETNYRYATYNKSTDTEYYFWNIYNVKEITELYGHDISNQFDYSAQYITSYSVDKNKNITWGSTSKYSNLIAWYDANQKSDKTCGVRDMFRILYKMPSLYNEQGKEYDAEVLIHNCRTTTDKDLYYYREEVKDDSHNYVEAEGGTGNTSADTNIGKQYISRTIGNEVRYFELVSSTPHNYGAVAAWNSSALFQPMEGYENKAENTWPEKLFENYGLGKKPNSDENKDVPPSKTAVFYTIKSYTLTLKDPTGINKDETVSCKFGQKITGEGFSAIYDKFTDKEGVVPVKDADKRGYWFHDASLTTAVDFNDFVMPAKNVTIYAGVKNSYLVKIDPNGGEMFGADGSSLGNDFSTWFRADAGSLVSEYKNIERNYIKADSNEATHKYVVNEYDASNPEKPRTAVYVKTNTGAEYKYEKGAYVLTGWVQVNNYKGENETESEYDFDEPVHSNLVLRAKWRRNANFRIVYDSDANDVKAPVDNNKYEDGAHAIAAASVDAPAGQRFTCWTDDAGNTYKPGQQILINEDIAAIESVGHMTIKLKASYDNYEPESNIMADYTFRTDNDVYYKQTISEGEELVRPAAPQKDGYIFKGWFKDSACTERFDGFGTVYNPVYTTLYAGFDKAFTVTYYDDTAKETVLTVQTYVAGDNLSTVGIQCDTPVGYIATGWTSGDREYLYNAYDKNAKVTGDMELVPVLTEQKHLNFVSNGGNYIAPVVIPTDRRPAMPKEPERKGYKFTGWFMKEDLDPSSEYEFDKALTEGVEKLYAGWELDDEEPATGKLTVAWWAQTSDRPENADNDYSHYELVGTETVEDFTVGTYTRAELAKYFQDYMGMDITGIHQLDKLFSRYYLDNKKMDPNNDSDVEVFKKFFEYNGTKSDSSVTVTDRGNHVLNIRFDRKTYTFKYDCKNTLYVNNNGDYSTHTINDSKQQSKIHYRNREYKDQEYVITAWIDRKTTELWPMVSSAREKSEAQDAAWIDEKTQRINSENYKYRGWKSENNKTTYITVQTSVDGDMINAVPESGILTYKMCFQKSQETATVHYVLDNVENTELQQPVNFIEGNVIKDATPQYYQNFTGKAIEGYICNDENPVYTKVGSDHHLTFNYTSQKYTVYLYENADDSYKVIENIKYGQKIDGADGVLANVAAPEAPEGKKFKCWAASPDVDTAYSGTMPEHNITLYAVWDDIYVTVKTQTQNKNDETVTESYGPFLYNTKFKEFGIPDQANDGEYFFGWKPAGSDSGMIDPDSHVTEDMTVVPVTKNLSGKTVTYNENGGGGDLPVDKHHYAVGAHAVVLSGEGLTNTAKDIDGKDYQAKFVCWNTDKDGNGATYYPGNYIDITGDVTLYAIYSSKRETSLVYNSHGENAEFVAETAGTELETMTAEKNTIRVMFKDDLDLGTNDKIGHPNSAMTIGHDRNDQAFFVRRPGYRFDNWSTDADANDGDIESGATAYANTIGVDANKNNNLYAIWDEDRLSIEAYTYEDDNYNDVTLITDDSNGSYHQVTVDTESRNPQDFENAYRAQLQKSNSDYTVADGFVYEKAMIGNDEVDALQYVMSADEKGYEWQYSVIGSGSFKSVGEKDTLKLYYHKCNNGELIVQNEVTGIYADLTKQFEYTLTVDGKEGSQTFKLLNGEKVKLTVPKGKKITLTQKAEDGYTTTFTTDGTSCDSAVTNGIEFKLTKNEGTVSVKNAHDDNSIVDSGIGDHNSLLVLLLIIAIFAEWIVLSIRRRTKRHA